MHPTLPRPTPSPQRVDLGDSYYLNSAFTVDYTAPCNASEAGEACALSWVTGCGCGWQV
jgi:hypothetical protein